MQYEVISFNSIEGLEQSVQEYLNAGWVCQGGISASGGDMTTHFFQAMVFYPENEKLND